MALEITLCGSESNDLPLDQRKRATIVRRRKPATLKFERIKDFAAGKQLAPSE
jgi:hypothetical protein